MFKYGVIKFQAPFEKLKEYNITPEVKLQKSIILQAIIDASNNSFCIEAMKNELEAKAWLFGNCENFLKVCLMADINPDHVVRTAKKVIRLNSRDTSKIHLAA